MGLLIQILSPTLVLHCQEGLLQVTTEVFSHDANGYKPSPLQEKVKSWVTGHGAATSPMEGGGSPGLKKSQSWTSELGISPFHWCCGNGPSYLSLTVASSRCYRLSLLHMSVSISPHSLPYLQSLLLKYF